MWSYQLSVGTISSTEGLYLWCFIIVAAIVVGAATTVVAVGGVLLFLFIKKIQLPLSIIKASDFSYSPTKHNASTLIVNSIVNRI